MDLFVRFLYDFLTLFFEGLKKIFLGLFTGIMDIFNLKRYYEVIKFYSEDLSTTEWILVILAALCVLIILGTIIFLPLEITTITVSPFLIVSPDL